MEPEFERALKIALRMLRASDKFRAEIEARLIARGFETQTVEAVLRWLSDKGVLNDERTLSNAFERLASDRCWGSERIRAALTERGAPEDRLAGLMASRSIGDERKAARKALQKKGVRTRASAGRLLASLGFEEELIESALDELFGTELE